MPFVLSQKTSYTWPVKYEYPKDDGRYEKTEFMAEFKRLPQSRLDELHKQAKEGTLDDVTVVDDVLIGWSGIKTADGENFEVTDSNRRILLDMPGIRAAIINSFTTSVSGSPRKN